MIQLTERQRARLDEAQDVWLATVRPDVAAHLVPVWAVRVGDRLIVATEPRSQKVRNIRAHPAAVLAVPDTRHTLILEGQMRLLEGEPPAAVLQGFQEKYDWSLHALPSQWVLLEFTPEKVLSWNSDES